MSKLDKILDDWLVHDSGCNFSLYNEPCDCIQSKVKVSVSREIKELMVETYCKAQDISPVREPIEFTTAFNELVEAL